LFGKASKNARDRSSEWSTRRQIKAKPGNKEPQHLKVFEAERHTPNNTTLKINNGIDIGAVEMGLQS